jgi:hypothetical protein
MNVADLSGSSSSSGWQPWYSHLNGDVNTTTRRYRDAMYDNCRESTSGSTTAIKGCLLDNWTNGSRRIDYIWARRDDGGLPTFGAEHTVTFNEGDAADLAVTGSDNGSLDHSQHRAVKARVHYS